MSNCPECGGKLGVKATKCRCGWVLPGAAREVATPAAVIPCCYSGCPEGAICRVPTKTGWANVCKTHYGQVEIVRQASNSPTVIEARKAYEKSALYQRLKSGDHVPGSIGALLPKREREAGEDEEELAA